jgi:hypothetical protein
MRVPDCSFVGESSTQKVLYVPEPFSTSKLLTACRAQPGVSTVRTFLICVLSLLSIVHCDLQYSLLYRCYGARLQSATILWSIILYDAL